MLLDDYYRDAQGRSISFTTLRVPRADDADSIGFVDIEDLKKLNQMSRRSTVCEEQPSLPSRPPPKGLNALKAWLKRRKELSKRKKYCYANPFNPDAYTPKISIISCPVQLPLPPPKREKPSMATRIQNFLVCGQK